MGILAGVNLCGSVQTDILTTYRTNGIKNIEKQLDKSLIKTSYWEEFLKDKNTTFGYIEKYQNILVCDKSKSNLTLYTKQKGNLKKNQQYSAYTGKLKGDKQKEGDFKTPIGIYNITKKISKLDSFYGPLAFVTSYPNSYDKYRGKTGHGVWIHGLPTNGTRDAFTKGCIAIENPDIECLDKTIDITKTILLINKTAISKTTSKKTLSLILSNLYLWRYAWLYNNLDLYLSFYADNFKRFDGMDKNKFIKYKTRIFAKNEKKRIIFTDLNVIPYPNTADIYQITFQEDYKSQSFHFNGSKTLIVKLDNNSFKIITEE